MKKSISKILIAIGLLIIGAIGAYLSGVRIKNTLLSIKCSKETADVMDCLDYWKILDPAKIDEKTFYHAEDLLLKGYSGTGGYFLDDQQIEWYSGPANLDQKSRLS